MGSSAYTCAVSGLPIEDGDAVRYLLLTKNPFHDGAGSTCYIHDVWFPRTLPLRAVYNDYCSVHKVETGAVRDTWLEGLKIDLVEQADGSASKSMDFSAMLYAVRSGRLLVAREVPSRAVALFQEVNRKRLAELDGDSTLAAVRKAFDEEAPTPSADARPLPISQAMIREDIWQALLKVPTAKQLEWYRRGLRAEADARADLSLDDFERAMHRAGSQVHAGAWLFRDDIPYTVGIGTHLDLLLDKGEISDEVINVAAEFARVTQVLSGSRYQWRPSSSSGPQSGEWTVHADIAAAVQRVAVRKAREQKIAQLRDKAEDAWWTAKYRGRRAFTRLLATFR